MIYFLMLRLSLQVSNQNCLLWSSPIITQIFFSINMSDEYFKYIFIFMNTAKPWYQLTTDDPDSYQAITAREISHRHDILTYDHFGKKVSSRIDENFCRGVFLGNVLM